MPRAPRLIAELIQLTRPLGWTLRDLARELKVSEVTLQQYRSGRRALSLATMATIAERFGTYREIKDLAWMYLREYHHRDVTPPSTVPADLPPSCARSLVRYVEHFAEETIHGGRGLFLVADTAPPLTAAVRFLRTRFETAGIEVAVLRADVAPAASELRAAAAAPLLVVERIDYVSALVADIVHRRADLLKPIVATSLLPPDAHADPYLRRIFVTRTRLVDLRDDPVVDAQERTPILVETTHADR